MASEITCLIPVGVDEDNELLTWEVLEDYCNNICSMADDYFIDQVRLDSGARFLHKVVEARMVRSPQEGLEITVVPVRTKFWVSAS